MIGQAELRIRLTTIVIAIAFASRTGQSEHPSGSSTEASGKRFAWTTSRIVGTPEPPLPYVAQSVFQKLQFERPLDEDEQPVASSKVVQKKPKKKTDRGR
ncbi:MAG: hypothetical protein ABGX22_16100 [Pirellulaceae bacterium]